MRWSLRAHSCSPRSKYHRRCVERLACYHQRTNLGHAAANENPDEVIPALER